MADEILYDPRQTEIRLWMPDGKTHIKTAGGMAHSKICIEMVRALVVGLGYDQGRLGVVNRKTGSVREWDIRKGQPGAVMYAEKLCTPEWRLATKEESKSEQERHDKARREAARLKLHYEEQAVQSLANARSFQMLVDCASDPAPMADMTEKEIKLLTDKLSEHKARIEKAKSDKGK